MSLIDSLTPKDTEEIKPGLFIQTYREGYRQINPIAWNRKWRLKKQFGWRNLFFILLVLFIAWSYIDNTKSCEEFQADPCKHLNNLTNFCREKLEVVGLNKNLLGDFEVKDGEGNSIDIQNTP